MRFEPEISDGANHGLSQARDRLETVKAKYPWISYGDLWTLAAVVSIKAMGGPDVPWRPGRQDAKPGDPVPPNGRLPDATKDAAHIRDLFVKRMGFTEIETVALILGGHTIGKSTVIHTCSHVSTAHCCSVVSDNVCA